MQVVLYTTEFEPITILDLPVWLLDQMERNGGARIAVSMPAQFTPKLELEPMTADMYMPEIVTIRCEKLRWRDGELKSILITPNEELALSLRPDWLPGQRQAINRYKNIIRYLQEQLIKQGRQL